MISADPPQSISPISAKAPPSVAPPRQNFRNNGASSLVLDRVHRLPRLWSNAELAAVSALFEGDVVNVSAWRDEDKAGRRYRDYFTRARTYNITNYRAEMRGFQNWEGEIFLDLEAKLAPELRGKFDVVFNHTTLEHVYEFRQAFANLCALSRDVAIIVAPWLQPYHSSYGDYWRFSPLAIARLFEENGLIPAYLNWNTDRGASIYVFAIGVRNHERWRHKFAFDCDQERLMGLECPAGHHAFQAPLVERMRNAGRAMGLGRIKRAMFGARA